MAWILIRTKFNVDFKNHVKQAIFRLMNTYKSRLYTKTILLLSAHKACYIQKRISKYKCLSYCDILEFSQGDYKIKSREDLTKEGYTSQLFSYVYLSESFKVDKNHFMDLNYARLSLKQNSVQMINVIGKMYKLFLKYETEEQSEKIG